MSCDYLDNENYLIDLFSVGTQFWYQNYLYTVVICGKPKLLASSGEPKTDVYIKAEQENSQVFKEFKRRTQKGSICLGCRLDLMNKKSGNLSERLTLNNRQKIEILTGSSLPTSKKNASVSNKVITSSGIANFILTSNLVKSEKNSQGIIKSLQTIDYDYVKNIDFYVALKALSYRIFEEKWYGDRPLAISIKWFIYSQKLCYKIDMFNPLMIKGNAMATSLRKSLQILNIDNTDQLNESNVFDYRKIVQSLRVDSPPLGALKLLYE